MLKGTQTEIPTAGQNEKQFLAAALDYRTGQIHYVIGKAKTNFFFRQLPSALDQLCGPKFKRIFIAADNYKIHTARAVERWLERHPRFQVLWLPSYCPQSNPIERAFGDVDDKYTRGHRRKCLQ